MYRLTIRIRSDDTIRPNTNTLFRPLLGTKANIWHIPTCNTYTRSIARLSVLSASLAGSSGFAERIIEGKPEHHEFDSGSFRLVATGM